MKGTPLSKSSSSFSSPRTAGSGSVTRPESLIARRCAYWVSLWGAPESSNATSQTVYIPSDNRLSVESLRAVMARASLPERIPYEL